MLAVPTGKGKRKTGPSALEELEDDTKGDCLSTSACTVC